MAGLAVFRKAVVKLGEIRLDCPGRAGFRVTDVTFLDRLDVRGVFAGGCLPVVAARTGAGDLGMVDRDDRFPGIYPVAVFANVGRGDMGLRFARGIGPVMAIDAQTLNAHVIKTGG